MTDGTALKKESGAVPSRLCGGPGGEIDHIVPISKGGDSGWENLTASCRSCNAAKHNQSLLPFLLSRKAA